MLERMPQPSNQKNLSDDDKRMLEFVDFIKQRGFTAEQLRAAYYHAIVPESFPLPSDATELVEEMRRLTSEGFPLNRFAILISTKEQYDYAVQLFNEYVESLSVSDKERRMLKSILQKKRTGELYLVVGGVDVMSANIVINKGADENTVALQLLEALKKLVTQAPQQKIEFRFED